MLIIHNIGQLVGFRSQPLKGPLCGSEMSNLPMLANAWLAADPQTGIIAVIGAGEPLDVPDAEVIDAHGGWLFPSFCDSHTHIIYAGSREQEFVDKIQGMTYEEVAARGGGILNSADRLHQASEQELYDGAMIRIRQMVAKGTGAIEIKSGYGLTVADELKMLRVARRLQQDSPAIIRTTFLGAHAVGREYAGRQEEYVQLVIREMLPAVAAEGLADFADVFCDRGFFTPEQTDRILEAAWGYGLRPKIHADELAASGGTAVGVKHRALSVDHLENAGDAEIAQLKQSHTIPTALPGASFFSNLPYAPARAMVDAGLPVALASDYNPGSSPSGDMRFILSLGCIKLRLTPQEALNAVTVNTAAAMDVLPLCGTLTPGLRANFFLTAPLPSLAYLPYAYTEPLIRRTFLAAREV